MKSEEYKELISVLRATNLKLEYIQGILLNANAKVILDQNPTEEEMRLALSYVDGCHKTIWEANIGRITDEVIRDRDSRKEKILVHEFWSPFTQCEADPSSYSCRCGSFLYRKATFSDFIDVLIKYFDYPKVRARTAEQLDLIIKKIGSSKVSDETQSFYRRLPGARFNKFELDHTGFHQMLSGTGLDIQIIGSADKYPDICIYRKQLGIATSAEVAGSMKLEADRYREARFRRGMR